MPAVVAIVGRQNVGKSSLLNAYIGKRVAIVHEHPGITRDRLGVQTRAGSRAIELVDTGGLAPIQADDLYEDVRRQVDFALARAALVLFVVDVQAGATPGDLEVARLLRKSKTPVILVANKADHAGWDRQIGELHSLGFGEPVAVSAAHRRGFDVLREDIEHRLPEGGEEAEVGSLRVAVIGRRNVGKSTFVNALAGEERVIVNERPGTTRDAVDIELRRGDRSFTLTDTAGLRKRGKMDSAAEFLGISRTQERLRQAKVVIFMLDATDTVSTLDRRIARQIREEGKICVVAMNKWDRVEKKGAARKYQEMLEKRLPLLKFAPVCFLSARQGLNVWETLEMAATLVDRGARRVATPALNRAIRDVVTGRPPPPRGTRRGKFFYAVHAGVSPPSFKLFVSDPNLFKADYRIFLENKLREDLQFEGLPLTLEFSTRGGAKRGR